MRGFTELGKGDRYISDCIARTALGVQPFSFIFERMRFVRAHSSKERGSWLDAAKDEIFLHYSRGSAWGADPWPTAFLYAPGGVRHTLVASPWDKQHIWWDRSISKKVGSFSLYAWTGTGLALVTQGNPYHLTDTWLAFTPIDEALAAHADVLARHQQGT